MDPGTAIEAANAATTAASQESIMDAALKGWTQKIIWIGLSMCFWMMAKDWMARMAAGLSFLMSRDFQSGDTVILDGEQAIIISIGTRQTTFQIREGKSLRWRYVPNHLIETVRLEKVVDVIENGHHKHD